MVSIIYWIGVVVSVIFLIYFFLCILKLKVKLQEASEMSIKAMPALRPIPIPTKNQKKPIYKFNTFAKLREEKTKDGQKSVRY